MVAMVAMVAMVPVRPVRPVPVSPAAPLPGLSIFAERGLARGCFDPRGSALCGSLEWARFFQSAELTKLH